MSLLAPWGETPRGKRRVEAICLIITVGVCFPYRTAIELRQSDRSHLIVHTC